MAIQTKQVAITEGSDAGKTFVVSQMPLLVGDKWANRAILAVLQSGVDVSALQGIEEGKFSGLLDISGVVNAVLKAVGGIEDRVAQQLLDELLEVVKFQLPDGNTRPLVLETDITSIATLWKIRVEAIKVNLDFLTVGFTQQ